MNHAQNLPNVDVWMANRDLSQMPDVPFPPGYRMRFYTGEEDIPLWVDIQQKSDPFFQATRETFERSLAGEPAFRKQRIMFLENSAGKAVGSISAWNGGYFKTMSGESDNGHVHWVAILPEAQGKGLSVPMLAACCKVLQNRGYQSAWLSTNTVRLPALNLYLKLGFQPVPRNQKEVNAWREVQGIVKYPVELSA